MLRNQVSRWLGKRTRTGEYISSPKFDRRIAFIKKVAVKFLNIDTLPFRLDNVLHDPLTVD